MDTSTKPTAVAVSRIALTVNGPGRPHRAALAELRHAGGDRDAARSWLAKAHQMFTALGVPRYVDRAERLAKDLTLPL